MSTATGTTLYVTLPHDENGRPEIHTSILAGAPAANRDHLSPAATIRINTAANRIDEDNCHDCGTPIGYHFDARTDPETFVNTGFHVTPDGTALCEDCAV